MRRALFVAGSAVLLVASIAWARTPLAPHDDAIRMETNEPQVTVYAASWCSACKSLEGDLRERGIPYSRIDIERRPDAYEVAKRATGKNVIPITSVARSEEDVQWIVGADGDAVEKAYRR